VNDDPRAAWPHMAGFIPGTEPWNKAEAYQVLTVFLVPEMCVL